MAIEKDFEKKLSRQYPPSARIDETFRGNDITIITDQDGDAVLLFIGIRKKDGTIKGERYARRILKKEGSEDIIKSHWDLKGRTS